MDTEALKLSSCEKTLYIISYEDGVEIGIGTRSEILDLIDQGIFGEPVFMKAI